MNYGRLASVAKQCLAVAPLTPWLCQAWLCQVLTVEVSIGLKDGGKRQQFARKAGV
ncbi:hypothetical protein [Microcoleus sp. herbarium14]|uniref:hypothetical protein n=1 Tax=Microcoleus sp. herbarium14 TaxID=3055439 RepID=UPI002FD5C1F2